MARVQLSIDDPASLTTLRTLLEADGHTIDEKSPQVYITDDTFKAIERSKTLPTLVLARATEVREAVTAMRQGVYGYLFVPFQPGEAGLMVRRALGEHRPESAPEMTTLDEVETRHILSVLRQCNNNQGKAARVLGIGRNTLWRKLKRVNTSEEPAPE
jgi:DNA-binding NtrC family response regulator